MADAGIAAITEAYSMTLSGYDTTAIIEAGHEYAIRNEDFPSAASLAKIIDRRREDAILAAKQAEEQSTAKARSIACIKRLIEGGEKFRKRDCEYNAHLSHLRQVAIDEGLINEE